MTLQQISDVIDKINNDIYKLYPMGIGLSLHSDINSLNICFLGYVIWDDRSYIWPESLETNEENFEEMLRMELVKLFAALSDLVNQFE